MEHGQHHCICLAQSLCVWAITVLPSHSCGWGECILKNRRHAMCLYHNLHYAVVVAQAVTERLVQTADGIGCASLERT